MERDYDWASVVHGEDLPDPAEIGRKAGENAVKRLNPKKISSAQVPVVYDPRVSQSILAHLAGAVNGASIARGTSSQSLARLSSLLHFAPLASRE